MHLQEALTQPQPFNYLLRIEDPEQRAVREFYSDNVGEMIRYLSRYHINPRQVRIFECDYPELRPADARIYNVANGCWHPF